MISGKQNKSEKGVILLFASHFDIEMISESGERSRFLEMCERLLKHGAVLFLRDQPDSGRSLRECLEGANLPILQNVGENEFYLGEKLINHINGEFDQAPIEFSPLELVDSLRDNGYVLIVNSFLLEEDQKLADIADIVISPGKKAGIKTGWEQTFFQCDSQPIEGWLQWAETMLKGIEIGHRSNRKPDNVSAESAKS